jgi:hypothetical protein
MREFWLWAVIVSLLILCIMGLSFLAVHQAKQLKKTEAILLRAEERDRKVKTFTLKDKDEE